MNHGHVNQVADERGRQTDRDRAAREGRCVLGEPKSQVATKGRSELSQQLPTQIPNSVTGTTPVCCVWLSVSLSVSLSLSLFLFLSTLSLSLDSLSLSLSLSLPHLFAVSAAVRCKLRVCCSLGGSFCLYSFIMISHVMC